MTETTEAIEQTREELEAEIAELRAANEKPATVVKTRELSPRKPEDHKPAATAEVTVEFEGVEFTVTRTAFESLRLIDLMERNFVTTALRFLVGDDKFNEFLETVPDSNVETAGKLLEAIAEKVGAKN